MFTHVYPFLHLEPSTACRKQKSPKQDPNPDTSDTKPADLNGGTSTNGFPALPEFFSEKTFFLYGSFSSSEAKKSVIRGIVAAGGKVKDYMGPEVDYVISLSDFDKNFEDALEVNSKVLFVRPDFIQSCYDNEKLMSPSKYLIRSM